MTAHAIPRESWGEALERFGDQHRDWLVSLSEQRGDASATTLCENAPLHEIRVETEASGSSAICIVVERDHGGQHVEHRVPLPWRVTFEETSAHGHVGLTIVSDDGARTELRFRVAAVPETVDGLL